MTTKLQSEVIQINPCPYFWSAHAHNLHISTEITGDLFHESNIIGEKQERKMTLVNLRNMNIIVSTVCTVKCVLKLVLMT
jgi:hypothetical protein